MKTIAVDIDDVLAASAQHFVDFSNQHWGHSFTLSDYDEHWQRMWGLERDFTQARARADFYHAAKPYTQLHGVNGANASLKRLSRDFRLVVATSRLKKNADETHAWLDTHYGGIFSDVHFAGIWDVVDDTTPFATKADLCRRIGADYLIDDQPKHCIGIAEDGKEALLFGGYQWNQAATLPKSVTRTPDWQAVEAYFYA